jgi:polysaccharide export outer membrane protein
MSHSSAGLVGALALSLLTCGCTGFLPRSGPTAEAIYSNAQLISVSESGPEQPLAYVLVSVRPQYFPTLSQDDALRSTWRFASSRGPGELRPGVGDLLSVTVYEAGSGGLFSSEGARNGGWTELPAQTVDSSGAITIPYAGRIRVAGVTLGAIQRDIEDRIKNRAIEPQVIVTIREQRSSQVSVLGQVTGPGTIPLSAGGMRIVDAISRAGGIRVPGYEAAVTLQRGGQKDTIAFDRLLVGKENNVYLAPGDVVYVAREPRIFTAFGAFGTGDVQVGRIEFEATSLTMVDALGKVRGLSDNRANVGAAFVFRYESRQLLAHLGLPVEGPPQAPVPTIYKFDFSDPSAYFMAGQFAVRNKDVLYVPNAQTADLSKFLTFLGLVTNVAIQAAGTAGIVHGITAGTGSTVGVATTPVTTPTVTPVAAP